MGLVARERLRFLRSWAPQLGQSRLHVCLTVCLSVCVSVYMYACLCVSASLLDSPTLSITACSSLAEIGRRNALPVQQGRHSLGPLHDHTEPSNTTNALTTDQLTTGSVVEKLIGKVKSTSENTKVSYHSCAIVSLSTDKTRRAFVLRQHLNAQCYTYLCSHRSRPHYVFACPSVRPSVCPSRTGS